MSRIVGPQIVGPQIFCQVEGRLVAVLSMNGDLDVKAPEFDIQQFKDAFVMFALKYNSQKIGRQTMAEALEQIARELRAEENEA